MTYRKTVGWALLLLILGSPLAALTWTGQWLILRSMAVGLIAAALIFLAFWLIIEE